MGNAVKKYTIPPITNRCKINILRFAVDVLVSRFREEWTIRSVIPGAAGRGCPEIGILFRRISSIR